MSNDSDMFHAGVCSKHTGGAVVADEVRVTDPVTGGQKGKKPQQIGALDPLSLLAVGEVAGFGAEKYDVFNFLKGYDYRLSYDALQRHLNQFWSGENFDEESGLPHIAHAAWHCLALLSFQLRGVGTDTRPPPCKRMINESK
jgi:hypothetical protein